MSTEVLHGDPPPIPDGFRVRVYSMEYCPYAQRARLALSVKGVPFDVINCDIQKKPKFLTDANPNGQVPVLLHDGNVVHESEVTVEYVDAAFPGGVRLYPADPFERAKVRMTIINFSNKVIPALGKAAMQPSEENWENALTALEKYVENPLKLTGGPYFGGKVVNAADIHFWPFFERIPTMSKTPLPADRFPALIGHIKTMQNTAGIKEVIHPPEDHFHFVESGRLDYNYHSKHPIYAA